MNYKTEQIRQCFKDFDTQNLWSDDFNVFKKNFLKWSLKNHPDKNPNTNDIYQVISGCKTIF